MPPEHADARSEIISKIPFHDGPPPVCGATIFERDIPSDSSLATALVVRTVEFLRNEHILLLEDEAKIGLCLEEALQNAVVHGNKNDFKKKVQLRIFLGEKEWGILVSDEGLGFDLEKVRDPLQSEGLWGESGRGLYLISHYMDRAEYFNGGNTLLMANEL